MVMRGLGSGRRFPGVAGEFGLLVGRKFVGESAGHAAGIQFLSGADDRIEDVAGGNHQQRNRFAFFFRDGYHGGKEFLLVMVEDLAMPRTTSAPLNECSR